MGNIGDKLLALILALLQGGGHIVKGQGKLRHFLAVVVLHPDPGFQVPVAEGVGGLGHILQRLTFPAGKEGHRRHGHQHHRAGGGEEDLGDLTQDLVGGGDGDGYDHDAHRCRLGRGGDGHGHHEPAVVVQAPDQAGGGIHAVVHDFIKVVPVHLKTLVPAAEGLVGAHHHPSAAVADHRVGVGDLGGDVQVQQEFPAA